MQSGSNTNSKKNIKDQKKRETKVFKERNTSKRQ